MLVLFEGLMVIAEFLIAHGQIEVSSIVIYFVPRNQLIVVADGLVILLHFVAG